MNLEDIESQFRSNSSLTKWLARKEVKELVNILHDNEVVLAAATGRYKEGNGCCFATTTRVIFIDKGWFSTRREDFFYSKISGVELKKGVLMADIIVFASGNKATIGMMDKQQADALYSVINNALHLPASVAPNQPPKPEVSKIEQLERLAKLKEQGILTEAEFESEKQKILN